MLYINIGIHITNQTQSLLYNISIGALAGIVASLFTIYATTVIDRHNKTYNIPKSNLKNLINKIQNIKTSSLVPGGVTVFGPHLERIRLYIEITKNEQNLSNGGDKEFNISNRLEPWLKAGTGVYPVHSMPPEEFDNTLIGMQEECSAIKPNWLKILFNIGK